MKTIARLLSTTWRRNRAHSLRLQQAISGVLVICWIKQRKKELYFFFLAVMNFDKHIIESNHVFELNILNTNILCITFQISRLASNLSCVMPV